MIISVNDTQGSEVFILKISAYDKKEAFISCIILNIVATLSRYVLLVVLVYLMFGMIFQLLSISTLKIGSVIPNAHINTIKSIWNKTWQLFALTLDS